MKQTVYYRHKDGESEIAIAEDGVLERYYRLKDGFLTGSIYVGKVRRASKGTGVFVDIGEEKDGLSGRFHRGVFRLSVEGRHFQRGEGGACIPVGKKGDVLKYAFLHFNVLPAEAARVAQGAGKERDDIFRGKGVQHENLAAGKQGAVHLKGGIFRGRTDKNDASFFHKGQEGILLGLVEAVYLVYENDGPSPVQAVFFRLLHDGAYFLDTAGHGGKVDERGLGVPGDDTGEGGFAHTRRSPENHGGYIVGFDEIAQYLALAEKVFLPEKFLQRAGPEPSGQGG